MPQQLQRYHIHLCLVRNEQPELENALQNALSNGYFLTWDFVGSPDNFMDFSRQQIDSCDYVLFVVGDSYGALSPTGVSYLHLSYVYASTKRKPICALIKALPGATRTQDTQNRQRNDFANVLEKEHAAHSVIYQAQKPDEVAKNCLLALNTLSQRLPKAGWLPATKANTEQNERLFTPSKLTNQTENAQKIGRSASQITAKPSRLPVTAAESLLIPSPVASPTDLYGVDVDTLIPSPLKKPSRNSKAVVNSPLNTAKVDNTMLTENVSDKAVGNLTLDDSLVVNYTAHAYRDGNLSELALQHEFLWLDIVVSLRKLKEPFSTDMIERKLNSLLADYALLAAKKFQPQTHAVARTQINDGDFNWVKNQLAANDWITATQPARDSKRETWRLSDDLK